VATSLLGLLGLLLVVLGALAVVASLAGRSTGQPVAAFARPLVMIGGTVALLDVTIYLSAYHLVADQYVNAAPGDVQAALYGAAAVGAVGGALHALWTLLLLGVVPILLGLAMYRTRLYPLWVAALAALAGLIELVVGVVGLLPIYGTDLIVVDLVGRLLVVAAVVAAGALLWRRPGRFVQDPSDAAAGEVRPGRLT
jgi:hypothetical protein